ncbi:hypothetical protein PILCRDRAFT_812757 [Piloderma croceum F 1598]|uniref:Uncharacterized protein n=1 Tax=Piloderma croceum (strain F 1598) TaxID=765440 RepID=A0A0C3G141_PILCF|nr:hypothetical protein PILCRDRAFT_812757 [Piloderma croceum F 1598]
MQAHLPLGTSKSKLSNSHGHGTRRLYQEGHQEDARNTKDRTKDLVSRFRGVGYQKRGLPYKKPFYR